VADEHASQPIAGREDHSVHVEAEDLLSTSQAGPAAVRGGALRLASFLSGTLLGVVGAALLFRHLGVVDTGHYTAVLNLSALVTGLTDLGLTAVGVRELAILEGERRADLARNLLGIRLALTTVGVVIITVFAAFAYGRVLAIGVLIAGAGVIVQNTQSTLQVPLMARLRLGWVSLLEFIRQILTTLLIIALVLLGAHLQPFFAAAGVAAVVVLVPTALLIRGNIPLVPAFQLAQWRALISPVLTYSIAVAAGALYFRIALVLVSLMAKGHEVGYFGLSYRVVEILFVIPGLLVGAAFPIFARAARDDPQRLGYAISRVFEVSLLAGVWIALTIAMGSHFAVEVVGGAKFLPAVKVLSVQGIAVGATFVSAVWGYGLLSLHLHRLILVFNLSMLALVAALVAALIPLDGAQGAALGIAAAELVGSIAGGVLLMRGRPHLAVPLRVVPLAALAALLGAAPALLGGLPDIVRVLLSSSIYVAVLLLLKAPPVEVYEVLPRRLRRGR
jgi:O-antigen/teichoic acid export membrane protein